LAAGALGGIIGLEREYRAKEAGFRTHFLVGVGSALFMVLSQYGFMDLLAENQGLNIRLDPSRIASQVVSGIGFIGAGTIIFQKHMVRGLTTAAGVWVTAAIGMTSGAGMYVLATAATVLVLIGLEAMNFALRRMGNRNINVRFTAPDKASVDAVIDRLGSLGAEVERFKMEEKHSAAGSIFTAEMEIKMRRKSYHRRLNDLMREFQGVVIEEIE